MRELYIDGDLGETVDSLEILDMRYRNKETFVETRERRGVRLVIYYTKGEEE